MFVPSQSQSLTYLSGRAEKVSRVGVWNETVIKRDTVTVTENELAYHDHEINLLSVDLRVLLCTIRSSLEIDIQPASIDQRRPFVTCLSLIRLQAHRPMAVAADNNLLPPMLLQIITTPPSRIILSTSSAPPPPPVTITAMLIKEWPPH